MFKSQKYLIVGSGFAAGMMAMHLLEADIDPDQIIIAGPGKLGEGNAFGCKNDNFRLNVRSQIMWIKPDQREEFTNWAKLNINDPDAKHSNGYFYRRHDFARFISKKLTETKGLFSVKRYYNKITKLEKEYNDKQNVFFWKAHLDDGKIILSSYVIMATGNPEPEWPFKLDDTLLDPNKDFTSKLIVNPWMGEWLEDIQCNEKVLFIGSGLTALDGITALFKREHQGHIYLISPHGKLPPMQTDWEKKKTPIWPGLPHQSLSASLMVKQFKTYLPKEDPSGVKWQTAWEELRTDLSINWQRLSSKDKLRLKKRFGSLWSRFRYRASPQNITAVNELKELGQLDVQKTRVTGVNKKNKKLEVILNNKRKLLVDKLINCSGVGKDKLVEKIISDNIAKPDCFDTSLEVDNKNTVLGTNSDPHSADGLFFIGPALGASLGDVVAASEVSMHAMELAKELKEKL